MCKYLNLSKIDLLDIVITSKRLRGAEECFAFTNKRVFLAAGNNFYKLLIFLLVNAKRGNPEKHSNEVALSCA